MHHLSPGPPQLCPLGKYGVVVLSVPGRALSLMIAFEIDVPCGPCYSKRGLRSDSLLPLLRLGGTQPGKYLRTVVCSPLL